MQPDSDINAPRWGRRKESRPAELIAAALDLFVERGYAATRLDEVAARAGVSKGTLYLYFSSKEDLFKAVVRETIVPMIAEYHRGIEQSELPSDRLLRDFFRQWWDMFGATKLAGIAKLIMSEAGNFPEVAEFFHSEVIEPNGAMIATVIRRGIRRGEFREVDVEAAAHLMIAPLILQAISAHSFDCLCEKAAGLGIERVLAAHADFVLAALRPQAGGARTAAKGTP
jgi:AcrR family transcriptional regulator